MDISQKISLIQNHYNLSVREFADRTNLGRGAVQTYVRSTPGKPASIPSLEAAIQILKTFPDISSDWFLFDIGEMLKSNNSSQFNEPAAVYDTGFKEKYFGVLEDLNQARKELIDCMKGHIELTPSNRPAKVTG